MEFGTGDSPIARISLNVTAIQASEAVVLRVLYMSPSFGYIQTPRSFNIYFSGCTTLTPPAGHVILLSSNSTLGFGNIFLAALFLGGCGQETNKGKKLLDLPVIFPAWLGPGKLPFDLRDEYHTQNWSMSLLYNALVTFDTHEQMPSLSLVFSYLGKTPQRVGRQWNCSRLEWPDMYLHFPCDLTPQCVGDEDETHCTYYTDKCGVGQWEEVTAVIFSRGHTGYSAWIDIHPTLQDLRNTEDIYSLNMYLNTWRWSSGAIVYNFHQTFHQNCSQAFIKHVEGLKPPSVITRLGLCPEQVEKIHHIVCRLPTPANQRIVLHFRMNITQSPVPLTTCRLKHVTHVALACDDHSLCTGKVERRVQRQSATCKASVVHSAPYWKCKTTEEHVPYSMLCDWSQNCGDNSDEAFCQFPPCGDGTFDCGARQCISIKQVCDHLVNCKSRADEKYCDTQTVKSDRENLFSLTDPPALVNLNKHASFSLTPLLRDSTQCPDSHFQCPGSGYCLPVYTRCNGMSDCPGHEDEAECNEYACEGLYRCRGKSRTVCMHVQHLCDGWPQCPQQDDELMCKLTESCPEGCVCFGATFTDSMVFGADTYPNIRHLEGRGSGLTMDSITHQTLLIYLGAGECQWKNLSDIALPNLRVLDISDNYLHYINFNYFLTLPNLEELDLSGNPLSSRWFSLDIRHRLESLLLLNLSKVSTDFTHLDTLSDVLPRIEIIDFSHSQFKSLQGKELFRYLKVLDFRGCPISDFSPDFLKEMDYLEHVFADNFKLCCGVVLPDDFVGKCVAPVDEISSCENLLKSGFYRAALVIFALAALLGNVFSFIYRLWSSSVKRKVGYAVFIIHLSVSDFFMGVYLLIIGVADYSYAGNYLWKESSWKGSTTCSISGFISLLSCEVSSAVLCLITLDRFLVLRFPFSRLHFQPSSAHVACIVGWVLGVILASVPLLPVTSHWAFFSQTGICIPLPVTRADFPGRHYSFSVMIVFNMVIFLLLAVGQGLIYWSVTVNIMTQHEPKSKDNNVVAKDKTTSTEAAVARRLLVIAMSDFLCWFPIGVCGLLAKLDVAVPGEVNTAMAVLVLPFNSALNPFLYTYTIVLEKRRKNTEGRLLRLISAQVKTELAALKR